ncbi:hypothetical protein [Emticicia sp. C21]|uniref:hypothetical protein n=1 Tax=Emticicia sp. C21 TaxID=2302915 RepID=UPI000E3435D3|nr:hypothetical protein [Emticicia sp. C21]RFS17341.1 hypothetical protein D0T08_06060 [Emticicia sp. C21]
MLPNTPLLKNHIRNSGIDRSASYNTRNFIIKYHTKHYKEEKDIDKFLEYTTSYNATMIHEWCHWIQNHCTSFGTFLHALKFSQEMTTFTNLRELPQEIKGEIINRRKNNQPIFIQNSKTKQPIKQTYSRYNSDINLFCQFWFDFQWVITAFEDSRTTHINGMPDSEVFGYAIGDIFLFYKSEFGERKVPTLDEARSWFNFEENSIVRLKIGPDELTSNSIMECAATISELQFLIGSFFSILRNNSLPEMIKDRLDILQNLTYGVPFNTFLYILGYFPNQIEELLSTVNILCFIALNPPLPPYYINPPNSKNTWEWHEINPPSRFILAAKTIKKIGLVKAHPNQKEIKEFILKVSDESKLITIIDEQNLNLKQMIDIDFANPTTKYTENNFLHQDFLFWVQNKFSAARDKYLPFISNTGTCFTGDLSRDSAEIIIPQYRGLEFTNSPLAWSIENKITFRNNSDFGNHFLRQVGVCYCLFDFIAGVGKYDLSEFPPELSKSKNFSEFISNGIINGIYMENQK